MNILQQNKKKILISLLIQALAFMPVFGIDLDYTVDDAIRKNYNVGTPIQPKKNVPTSNKKTTTTQSMPKLPNLPNNTKSNSTRLSNPTTSKVTPKKKTIVIKKKTQITNKNKLPLRKGMQFDIVNINPISDKQRVGTQIVFVNPKPIKTAYCTIPQGTKFVGKIVESHTPQITGNGGLVSIKIDTILFGGQYQYIDTRITKVGGKKVFFEDIKGKRSYWKNTREKGKWGRNTYRKMNKLSSSLAKDKTTVILSPFTFVYGAAMGGISTAVSPVVSVFCKGKNVYIPQNTPFRIKFEQDSKLYY